MSKDRSAYRSVGYIYVRDSEGRTDCEGEVGEVLLVRALLAGKGKPSGRIFGSIVLVGVVERSREICGRGRIRWPRPIDGFAGRETGLSGSR